MSSLLVLGELAELAEDQWGLLTHAQSRRRGVAASTLHRLSVSGGPLEHVAHGVYRLRGTAADALTSLRAAWLQLAPTIPAWDRRPEHGVVSHRSAAAVHRLGDLLPIVHDFTLPGRKQSRRQDVRLHRRSLRAADCSRIEGLLVTSAPRLIADLLLDDDEPSGIGEIIVDSLRRGLADKATLAAGLAPLARRHGHAADDGAALLETLMPLSRPPGASLAEGAR